ncbi:MAG: HlyD family secretion protein [Planctomycetes bacterium]|nr:HlyD family secretion protein [Planctomycetota bacterium]
MNDLRPIKTPLREYLRELRLHILPFVVWLGGWALIAVLWMQAPKPSPLVGFGLGDEVLVAAPEDGQIDEVFVDLFDDVRSGQVLVALNSLALDAGLIEARAELVRLEADLSAARASFVLVDAQRRQEIADERLSAEQGAEFDRARRLRSFRVEEQGAQIDALEATLARVDADLDRERVQVRLTRAQGLLDQAVGSEAEVKDLRAELAQAEGKAAAAREVEDRVLAAVVDTRAWREEFEAIAPGLPERAILEPRILERLAGHEAALAVQRTRIAALEARVGGLLVRAPRSGRIASLMANPGEQVLAAQELLRLEMPTARGVLVYVPEDYVSAVAVGDRIQLRRGAETAEARVLATSPGLIELPARLWYDPRIAEYGWTLRLAAPVGFDMHPGERVGAVPRPADS